MIRIESDPKLIEIIQIQACARSESVIEVIEVYDSVYKSVYRYQCNEMNQTSIE